MSFLHKTTIVHSGDVRCPEDIERIAFMLTKLLEAEKTIRVSIDEITNKRIDDENELRQVLNKPP